MGESGKMQTGLVAEKRSGYPAAVRWWLIAGVLLVIGQVVIGGITRLTESGLSITEWEVVSGSIPPLNEADWNVEFDKYKASPQYEKIMAGISLSEFKFIYFWEWFHRQWARMMGLIFAVGFVIFWRKGWLDPPLMKRLGVVVLLAAITASFGWIMVASGLHDRPWVNAYKLTMHLSLGITLFSYLLWTTFKVTNPKLRTFPHSAVDKWIWPLNIVLGLQLILGGIMSGARAALPYPTWPSLNGHFIPPVLLDSASWTVDNMVYYEQSLFQPALIQFLHRMTAYTLTVITLAYVFMVFKDPLNRVLRKPSLLLVTLLITQVILGVATVVSSIGQVPVGLGVAHQFTAIALVGAVLYVNYVHSPGRTLKTVDN
ncbi:COX15/CtaA family protein [Neolewinella antarctica]|uniref:Cytochrome c oxidase assembly protein subunit 15 n=1 Tax=Neolewinella antarctica TaxID=442734 RepID=A0ABX0XDZ8_9BACT|nr:COX15/CtaA family protein [Neolewinella antarctica]NJC27534.1 cytochrome c oxidase assembly protein subunit 15 [Neolewinella antarctica]